MKNKKNLLIILGMALLAVMVLFLSRLLQSGKTPEGFVRIVVNNRLYAVEALGEERDIEVIQPNGNKNIVHLTRDGFSMAYSTCDNQLCVNEGPVTADNYARRVLGTHVLCLPNWVDVELVLTDRTPPPDMPDI